MPPETPPSADPPRPRRGRPARLSRDGIVKAALALLDDRGLEGLTMRALARELGADPMAVYRHVRDKDDLLGALCDAVLDELGPLELDGPWRPQLERFAHRLHDRLVARPALLPVIAGAPATPANVVLGREILAFLDSQGVPLDVAGRGFAAVYSYVLGAAVAETAFPGTAGDPGALRAATLEALGGTDDAPPPFLDEAVALLDDPGDFAFGLELLLDGIERRAERAR